MKLNNSYTRIVTTIILSVISTGNMIAFAQLSVQGKNENGQSYQYFYWNYPSYSIIDSVQLCVDYISDFAVDTTEGIRVRETSLLEIGKSTSKFLHRQKFIADSLHRIGYGLARQTDHLFEDVAYPLTFFEAVFQNYPEGRLTCAGKIITQDFIYEEDMPTFDWSISDSTRTILGLTCFKATCRFRGRDWTVWFAPGYSGHDRTLEILRSAGADTGCLRQPAGVHIHRRTDVQNEGAHNPADTRVP